MRIIPLTNARTTLIFSQRLLADVSDARQMHNTAQGYAAMIYFGSRIEKDPELRAAVSAAIRSAELHADTIGTFVHEYIEQQLPSTELPNPLTRHSTIRVEGMEESYRDISMEGKLARRSVRLLRRIAQEEGEFMAGFLMPLRRRFPNTYGLISSAGPAIGLVAVYAGVKIGSGGAAEALEVSGAGLALTGGVTGVYPPAASIIASQSAKKLKRLMRDRFD